MSSPQPPTTIYNAVRSQAITYGVPDALWEDVAYTESGYNPKAIGDNGTSFGLFQLHIGGQLPAQYNNNPDPVFDPGLNAQLAMPDIAKAWNSLKGSFNPNNSTWWSQFAAQSGHPGGSPGQAVTENEARKLQQFYNGGSIIGDTTSSSIPLDNPIGTITGGIGTNIQNYITSILPKIGLFVLAVILVVIGVISLK